MAEPAPGDIRRKRAIPTSVDLPRAARQPLQSRIMKIRPRNVEGKMLRIGEDVVVISAPTDIRLLRFYTRLLAVRAGGCR
jgi:hypothetical protein